ncbi:MAG: GNAT family N-acetyltransferase [Rhizobacter sp.]|nr:GNAT family N-acetyltransferase [Rhizobacter sp.]
MSPPPEIEVQRLDAVAARREMSALCELLVDCVEGGASVGFVAPMSLDKARHFWDGVADAVARGESLLLVARTAGGRLDGTVQLQPAQKENQPHRADIAKLLVHRRARRLGVGAELMRAAEGLAWGLGRTVLVLDTATPEAERLYRRQGWQLCGEIPDYALMPDGSLCATRYFYKRLTSPAP